MELHRQEAKTNYPIGTHPPNIHSNLPNINDKMPAMTPKTSSMKPMDIMISILHRHISKLFYFAKIIK